MMLNVHASLLRLMRHDLPWLGLCFLLSAPVVQAQDSPATDPGAALPQGGEPPASYRLADVEITLARNACFGTCPVYEVRIFGDGRVVYDGKRFVRVEGEQQSAIDKAEVLRLLERIYASYFFDMNDMYEGRPYVSEADGVVGVDSLRVSDVPAHRMSVRLGTYEKTVIHLIGGPPGLTELFDLIDEIAGTKRWIE
jgi:hypothetical protein